MSRKMIAGIKIGILAVVLAVVAWKLYADWREIGIARLSNAIDIDWRWSVLAGLCFAGIHLTSGAGWLRLLRRIDSSGPPVRLLGAYVFSQMGKYVPGKVMLLIMRLERAKRLGASNAAVTLSTLLENAAFMISGAATAVLAILRFYIIRDPAGHRWLLIIALSCLLVTLAVIHPAVFYRILNPVLRKLRRSEIPAGQRLSMRTLLASVALMTPVWFLGGLALWAAIRCLVPVSIEHFWELMAAFSMSVLIGMISFLPGGLGVREVVQALFLLPIVSASIPEGNASFPEARFITALAVLLQRLFQIIADVGLGVLGGWLTTQDPIATTTEEDSGE